MSALAGARTALGFLTRVPVGRRGAFSDLNAAAVFFPLVGLLVGGVIAGVRALAELAVPPAPATVLAVLAGVIVTGGLHEDGLADTADAAGAHTTRERRLEILRDPRVGTFGAVAVAGALLLAVSLLASLDVGDAARAAVVAHVLARAALLAPSRLVGAARADGSGRLLHASTAASVVATAVAVVVALLVAGAGPGAVALLVAAVGTVATTAAFARLIGGLTGDGYGTIAKVVELGVLVALVGAWT